MSYAANTTVSIDKSQAEIKKNLNKYEASASAFLENKETAVVQFEMSGKRVKFVLPLPILGKECDRRNRVLNKKQLEQLTKSKWRSLSLAIKAKLESVDAGITTFEQEFMAHIVLPNGKTVGDIVIPEIESSYQSKSMPLLLGMGS